MDWFFLILLFVMSMFAFVLFRGAPYVPTLNSQIDNAFELLDLKPGQILLELGSGDGRILRAAAEKGIHAVGFELNPLLVIWTKLKHWRYRSYIKVYCADFWVAKWPESDAMFVFQLPKHMDNLDNKIVQYAKSSGYRIVSFSFDLPDKSKFVKSKGGMKLYKY